nr:serine/threonine-protein kinase ATG1t isoform X1 [Ipomoea batatas]
MESESESELGSIGEYKILCRLGGGAGAGAQVWKAEHKRSGQVVALKQIRLSNLTPHLNNCLHSSLTFLSSVNHPNIIRLFHFFQAEDCFFMVLEFCDGGNLASYIHHHGRVQQCVAKGFIQQLGAGLQLLNSHRIIHRDLKPENILLSLCGNGPVLKIADFGMSRTLNPDEYAETVCGTPFYMAPEVLQFQRYNEKVKARPLMTSLNDTEY